MSFTGIPVAALDFYEDLEADNTKAFWTAHKLTYDEQVKAPLEALANELERQFGAWKLFRPYRDVRFSKDKTPYKTAQGMWFDETRTYVHVSAAGLFLAAGYYQTSSAQVARLRRAVDDDVAGPALERVVAALRRKHFEVGGETITRVPSGYDREHPREELMRHKTLVVSREVGCPAWLSTPAARAEIAKTLRAFAPLVAWLDTHVGHD